MSTAITERFIAKQINSADGLTCYFVVYDTEGRFNWGTDYPGLSNAQGAAKRANEKDATDKSMAVRL